MRAEPALSTWDTFPVRRLVLMVCRTLTSTIRLLETHKLFRDDTRLYFEFALDPGSEFSAASEKLLRDAGVPNILDWSSVDGLRPHLTLAASENVDMESLHGTVIVLPHGVGLNKFVPAADGTSRRVAGAPPAAAFRTGRLRLALAHPSEDRQLAAEAADHTVVTGDPTLDQLTASLRLRERYRELLHATGKRVVLISSTWGPESTIGAWRTLPAELLGALPADEYRVCLALHPNIWARYGRHGVENYLAKALDAGLVLLPPEAGWHAALVASHVVVADHGSLALYAAALGKPLLLKHSTTEIVPGTPMADLLAAAAHLDPRTPLAPQIEHAHVRDSVSEVADRAFAHRGEAIDRLRHTLYETLGLDPCGETTVPRVPDPVVVRRGPRSFRTHTSTTGAITTLVRYPSTVDDSGGHLAVTDEETALRLHERAAVVCRDRLGERALDWARHTLTTHPGARLTAAGTDHGCVVVTRDGQAFHVTTDQPADVPALGSLAYSLLLAGGLGTGTHTLSLGDRRVDVRITQSPA